MINETKRRGNLYMYAGLLLAALSAILIYQQISAKPNPPEPESVVPVLYVVDYLVNRTSLEEALFREGEFESVCPERRADFEGEEPTSVAMSAPIGAFQICAIPKRFVTPSMVDMRELLDIDLTSTDHSPLNPELWGLTSDDPEVLQPVLDNSALIRRAIGEKLGNAYTTFPMVPGDFLQFNTLDSVGGLDENMRAVSISVNKVTSVGGTIRPGQRVDVVVSYERNHDPEGLSNDVTPVTELLLQNVEVLSVSGPQLVFSQNNQFASAQFNPDGDVDQVQQFDPTTSTAREATVTLALPLEDALEVIFMANFAREVRLITRRGDDGQIHQVAPISQENLGR